MLRRTFRPVDMAAAYSVGDCSRTGSHSTISKVDVRDVEFEGIWIGGRLPAACKARERCRNCRFESFLQCSVNQSYPFRSLRDAGRSLGASSVHVITPSISQSEARYFLTVNATRRLNGYEIPCALICFVERTTSCHALFREVIRFDTITIRLHDSIAAIVSFSRA